MACRALLAESAASSPVLLCHVTMPPREFSKILIRGPHFWKVQLTRSEVGLWL